MGTLGEGFLDKKRIKMKTARLSHARLLHLVCLNRQINICSARIYKGLVEKCRGTLIARLKAP